MLASLLRSVLAVPLRQWRGRRASSLVDLAIARQKRADHAGALRSLERAIALDPASHDGWNELGNVHLARGDPGRAIECYRRALGIDARSAVARFNLGLALREAGAPDEAMAQLRRAHAAAPGMAGPLRQLVTLLVEKDLCDRALAVARRAVERDPGSYEARLMLGFAHFKLNDPQRALECYDAAATLRPEDAELCDMRACALQVLGRIDEAFADFDRALGIAPRAPRPRFHRALASLLAGDFGAGWDGYELRQISGGYFKLGPSGLERWDGAPLAGRTLLIRREQGLGDEIMFASILPELIAAARHCVLECDPRLRALFARSFPSATVFGSIPDRSIPHALRGLGIELEVDAGSLPRLRRRSLADFPRHSGYLAADPARVAHWRARLAALGPGLKVGLSWTGGLRVTRRELRSIALEQLLPVLRVPGVRFVSLQYTDEAEAELAALGERHAVHIEHWQEAIDDYGETAALACALDHVVAVCTSLVHLGGALGRPVWVMAPHSPEWRYGYRGETMPWYPSVRIFRQPAFGQWQPVIDAVAANLARLVGAPPG